MAQVDLSRAKELLDHASLPLMAAGAATPLTIAARATVRREVM